MTVNVAELAGGTVLPTYNARPMVANLNPNGTYADNAIGITAVLTIQVLALPTISPEMPAAEALPVAPTPPPVTEAFVEVPQPIEAPTNLFVETTAGVTSTSEVRFYELRLVTFDKNGKPVDDPLARINLNDPALKAIYPFNPSKLPALFGRLPADRYRIYLIEDGAQRLILEFTIQQGQPIETPGSDDANIEPSIPVTEPANHEIQSVPVDNGGSGNSAPPKNGTGNSGNSSHEPQSSLQRSVPAFPSQSRSAHAANAFAERLGRTPFLSHGGVVVGATILASATLDDWEKSIDRLMERFDRRRRMAGRTYSARKDRQLAETSSSTTNQKTL